MGCLITIIRAGAAMVLCVVIFVGFLAFLILNNFSDKLLSSEFYTNTIAAEDTYNRIYEEVLVDEELSDRTSEFLGDIQIVTHQDIVDLMREIVPPEYIQAEVERTIERTIAYINEDVDVLEAYVDLSKPLANVKTVLFAYIDGRIDGLTEEDPGNVTCSIPGVIDLAEFYADKFTAISNGEIPTSVPSLKALDPLCRQVLFATTFDLLAVAGLDAETTQQLRSGREELRVPFEAGDTLGMLKISVRLLAEPRMDKAINRVREELGEGDRFDLIRQIGEWNPDRSEAQIRADLDEGRRWISRARSFGDVTGMIMFVGGAVLMGLVFFPSLSSMLRWPGINLFITGVFFFFLGKVAESEVPARLTRVIETGADQVSGVPPSVTNLGGDILISFGSQMTDGLTGPSLTLLIVGASLFGASFFTFIVKRFIPFVK